MLASMSRSKCLPPTEFLLPHHGHDSVKYATVANSSNSTALVFLPTSLFELTETQATSIPETLLCELDTILANYPVTTTNPCTDCELKVPPDLTTTIIPSPPVQQGHMQHLVRSSPTFDPFHVPPWRIAARHDLSEELNTPIICSSEEPVFNVPQSQATPPNSILPSTQTHITTQSALVATAAAVDAAVAEQFSYTDDFTMSLSLQSPLIECDVLSPFSSAESNHSHTADDDDDSMMLTMMGKPDAFSPTSLTSHTNGLFLSNSQDAERSFIYDTTSDGSIIMPIQTSQDYTDECSIFDEMNQITQHGFYYLNGRCVESSELPTAATALPTAATLQSPEPIQLQFNSEPSDDPHLQCDVMINAFKFDTRSAAPSVAQDYFASPLTPAASPAESIPFEEAIDDTATQFDQENRQQPLHNNLMQKSGRKTTRQITNNESTKSKTINRLLVLENNQNQKNTKNYSSQKQQQEQLHPVPTNAPTSVLQGQTHFVNATSSASSTTTKLQPTIVIGGVQPTNPTASRTMRRPRSPGLKLTMPNAAGAIHLVAPPTVSFDTPDLANNLGADLVQDDPSANFDLISYIFSSQGTDAMVISEEIQDADYLPMDLPKVEPLSPIDKAAMINHHHPSVVNSASTSCSTSASSSPVKSSPLQQRRATKRLRIDSYEDPTSVQSDSSSTCNSTTSSRPSKSSVPATPKRRGRPPKAHAATVSPSLLVGMNESDVRYIHMRNKNNEASRRSRINRKDRELILEDEATELEEEHKRLAARCQELEDQVKHKKQRLIELASI